MMPLKLFYLDRDFAYIQSVKISLQHLGTTFDWSAEKQALILGSYFWSYPVTSLLGGMAAERWGPRYIVFITSLASGILTALSPVAARWSYIALVVIRFLLGFTGVRTNLILAIT